MEVRNPSDNLFKARMSPKDSTNLIHFVHHFRGSQTPKLRPIF